MVVLQNTNKPNFELLQTRNGDTHQVYISTSPSLLTPAWLVAAEVFLLDLEPLVEEGTPPPPLPDVSGAPEAPLPMSASSMLRPAMASDGAAGAGGTIDCWLLDRLGGGWCVPPPLSSSWLMWNLSPCSGGRSGADLDG